MKKCALWIWLAAVNSSLAVGTGPLQIHLYDEGHGCRVSSITVQGTEILNPSNSPDLFTLFITNTETDQSVSLGASNGWGSVTISDDGTNCSAVLTHPVSATLPDSLHATLTITATNARSQWDLSISGLGNCTLTEAYMPHLNVAAPGSDFFLLPRYSGILMDDPVTNSLDWRQVYPAGWHASMPFFSYYNAQYSLYLGFHDPEASLKYFEAVAEDGGVALNGDYPIPDQSIAGNDWEMPGVFELDAFSGDWVDAALIYKAWASSHAAYWPQEDPAREARRRKMAGISLWATFGGGYAPSVVEANTLDFADYMGVPVGLTWYQWNTKDFDDDYPEYFPEQTGMAAAVSNMQAAGIRVVPYLNGRLFDMDLDGTGPSGLNYPVDGAPYAAKDIHSNALTQTFSTNTFAVMCPSQIPWQNILTNAAGRLTRNIGSDGLYIDQVCAATPAQCMDPAHAHPLAGGHWWTSSYSQMFQRIHTTIPENRFLTSESGADFLVDQVDGFMVQGWQADKMVPAFQTIYSDKVLLFGMKTGVSQYPQQQFYCKLAQAFSHGIQLGRFYTSIQNTTGEGAIAPVFVRKLGRLHHKLNTFMTHGSLQRPLNITNVPTITCTWTYTYDGDIPVTLSAIQTAAWRIDRDGEQKVALTFVNASLNDTHAFSFVFDAGDYGMSGPLYVQTIAGTNDGPVAATASIFTNSLTLGPRDAIACVVSTSPAPLGEYNLVGAPRTGGIFRIELREAAPTKTYEIEHRNGLIPGSGEWGAVMTGALGQTTFDVPVPADITNYFRANQQAEPHP